MSVLSLNELRLIHNRMFTISVDNSDARSFNINIDRPTYFCFAISEEEAIGKMIKSDFEHKYKPIMGISTNELENTIF